ncbi:MAG: hypothetical protein J6M60_01715 [Clostridia bacterium]|nr:hypothetical protein [Clostridia bacterium]
MNNKFLIVVIILVLICGISGLAIILNTNNKLERTDGNKGVNESKILTDEENVESENEMNSKIRVIINGKDYNATLEENETTQSFMKMLPKELNMSELNGNEKYVYLDSTLPTNSYNPHSIVAGDIMLFGNNCLVVFYKSFETSYSYTKIGHIENLPDLGNENIVIKFEK